MAAYARRAFAGGGVTTTLAGAMGAGDTSFTITSATGWPGASPVGNFYVVIDRGLTSEEKILCASNTGTTVTVAASGRGVDGTSATSHLITATVSICVSAVDGDEANQAVVQLLGQSGVAAGDLNYVSGTSPTVYTRLGIGANTRILTSTGTAPQWSTVANAIASSVPVASSSFTPTWTDASTNPVLGNGTLLGQYTQVGALVTFYICLIAGSTTTYGTGGVYSWALPVASAAFGHTQVGINCWMNASSQPGGAVAGQGRILSGASTVQALVPDAIVGGAYVALAQVGDIAGGGTFGHTNDEIRIQGSYFTA